MVINLKKGQRISLVKAAPGLERVLCGLGWDIAERPGGWRGLFVEQHDYDLDATVLCLDRDQKLQQDSDLIYFGNLRHASGAITHMGDHLTGGGAGDNEQILVDLNQVPDRIQTLMFVVTIYRCRDRQQHFGNINQAFVRLINLTTQQEFLRYDLSGREYDQMTTLKIATLDRVGGNWEVSAVGEGLQVDDLKEVIALYRP